MEILEIIQKRTFPKFRMIKCLTFFLFISSTFGFLISPSAMFPLFSYWHDMKNQEALFILIRVEREESHPDYIQNWLPLFPYYPILQS